MERDARRLQQGFFLGAATLPVALLRGVSAPEQALTTVPTLAPLLALLAFVGAALLGRPSRIGPALISASVLGTATLAATVARGPLAALTAFAAGIGLLGWIWGWTAPGPAAAAAGGGGRPRGAAWGALLVCLVTLFGRPGDRWCYAAAAAALLVAAGISAAARGSWARRRTVLAATLAALGAVVALHRVPRAGVLVALGAAVGLLAIAARAGSAREEVSARWSAFLYANPARMLVLSFLAVVVVGSALLTLPDAARGGGSFRLVDALFTSTSATCVTGLTVLDTAEELSTFGQLVVLALIQTGGLGIMIFSVAALSLAGRRLSLRQEAAAVELVGAADRRHVVAATRTVLFVTLVSEAVGALVLAALFVVAGDAPGAALWRGLFTAVSAFCNAGFALQTESLIPYQDNASVLLVVAALIVLGGLGPAVVRGLPQALRGGPRVPIEVKLVLVTTTLLLAPPALFILAAEWRHALHGQRPTTRVVNALFQSVTTRTAGFNALDQAALRPATLWITMGLMFVGGSPASTAGGIKTTTAALLTLMIHAALVGRTQIRVFGRRVPQRSAYRAVAVATLAALTVIAVVMVLQLTQQLPLETSLFEAISALGTVGLSTGGTTQLDAVGKLLIAATMFAGRVGPLSLFMVLAARVAAEPFELPEEDVLVG